MEFARSNLKTKENLKKIDEAIVKMKATHREKVDTAFKVKIITVRDMSRKERKAYEKIKKTKTDTEI